MDELLFHSRGHLSEFIRKRRQLMRQEVNDYNADDLLHVSETDLIEYFFNKYSLDPPKILDEKIYQTEPRDADVSVLSAYHGKIHVRGTTITIIVPIQGDARLFGYQPSRSTLKSPRGEVYPNKVVLTFEMHNPDKQQLQQWLSRALDSIREYLEWTEADVKQYNESLTNDVRRAISQRKAKLLADRELSQSLDIPIVRREDAPRTYVVPQIRRKPDIARPTAVTEEPFAPEPALAESEYEHILNSLRNMAQVMELSPHAFATMEEEDLRTHFLVQLNAQYEGQATGETFNFQGRADIIIKVQGKNVFIAECKFWRGAKRFADTIDQLLGYLSWRDTKTAILLFSRNRDFTNVLDQIPGVVREHPSYKRTEKAEEETEFRYILHQLGDPNREVILSVLAFDIPRNEE